MSTVEIRGRSLNRARSPASSSQMRPTAAGSSGGSTKVTCLVVSVSSAKYSTSSRRSTGTSEALTCVHITSSCGSSSMRPVHSRRSCSVLARRTPVRKSSVLATQPLGAKWNGSPSSSRTSSSGVAPASTSRRGHCASAHSTSSRGRRAIPDDSSTRAPRAASSVRTAEPAKRMPTSASNSIASSAMRSFSSTLSHSVFALMDPPPSGLGSAAARLRRRRGRWHVSAAVSTRDLRFARYLEPIALHCNVRCT